DALDTPEKGAEDGRAYLVPRGGRRGVGAVAIDVACGEDLAIVEFARGVRAFEEIASAYQLGVAGVGREFRPGLADAVPVYGGLVDDFILELVVAPAQPHAEQRGLRPAAPARARPVGFARLGQGRMFGRDTTVDDADDDVLAR